jgi:hypothetical protein
MPNKISVFLNVCLVVIVTGCGNEDEPTAGLFTELPEYKLEQVEMLSGQGDMILGRPTAAEIDSDGNRLVMDIASFEFHVFDSEGIYQNSFGSQGEGPGEFQQPTNPVISEQDTLYVSDNLRRSLIVYSRSADYSWEHAYDISFPPVENGYPFYALTPSQTGYPIVYQIQEESEDFPNGYSTVKLVNKEGEIIHDTDLKFRTGEMLELNMGGNRISLRFSEMHSTQITPFADGTFLQAWTPDPVLHHFSSEGDTLRSIELENYPRQRATSDAISSLTERYGGQFGNLESDMKKAIGDFFPAFSQIRIMKDNTIWLRRITPGDSNESWYHLAADGVPLGTMTLEEGVSLGNSVSDYIYVSGANDDGSPVIIKYRLSAEEV